jgi:hypothetical protein
MEVSILLATTGKSCGRLSRMRYHNIATVAGINSSGLSFCQTAFVIARTLKPQQEDTHVLNRGASFAGELWESKQNRWSALSSLPR